MLTTGTRHIAINVGTWVAIPHLYHFSVKLQFDRLSVPFAILSFVLAGTIGAFASKYMHRERGFNRFFMLYSIFVLGMEVTAARRHHRDAFSRAGSWWGCRRRFWWRSTRSGPLRRGTDYGFGSSTGSLTLRSCSRRSSRTSSGVKAILMKLLGPGPWPDEISAVTTGQALVVGTGC